MSMSMSTSSTTDDPASTSSGSAGAVKADTDTDTDTFQLYDLRVEVICPPGKRILCGAKEGDHFTLEGEMLYLPPGQGISIYSLSAVLPLLAAKQRTTARSDWMSTDAEVACPDPCCPSRLRIVRTGVRTFRHGDTTLVPLPPTGEDEDPRRQ